MSTDLKEETKSTSVDLELKLAEPLPVIDLTGRPIHQILQDPPLGKRVQISAWAKQFRLAGGGKLMFIHLGDGMSTQTLQVVYDIPEDYDQEIYFEASVQVTGIFLPSPAKGQAYEVKADSVQLIGKCDPEEYPFSKGKKGHPLEFLRQYPHLRPKTRVCSSIMRMRDALSMATHEFFHQEGFFWVHTPILTTSDCEGAGETFHVTVDKEPKFFRDKQAYLTVSGQLQVEPFACALSKVYVFGPSFRAEKSSTTRHLSEFMMLEPEVAFADLDEIIQLAEDYIRFAIQKCLTYYRDELEFLSKRLQKPKLIQKLEATVAEPFAKITYGEAIELLKKSKKKFEKPCEWGVDLGSDQEKFICEKVFKKPTFITHYPAEIKAFYMYQDDVPKGQPQTVGCMDLLVPEIGEVVGGSQREHRYEVLEQKIAQAGLQREQYEWYLDTRKYGGVPHSGFGVGFDRLLRFITGVDHIMDVVPYPIRFEHI